MPKFDIYYTSGPTAKVFYVINEKPSKAGKVTPVYGTKKKIFCILVPIRNETGYNNQPTTILYGIL